MVLTYERSGPGVTSTAPPLTTVRAGGDTMATPDHTTTPPACTAQVQP